jgi:hypothetical protein
MTLETNVVQNRDSRNMCRGKTHDHPDVIAPIVRSGLLAREFCRRGADAEIAAVFERSIYLRCADAFVCLGEPAIGNGPLTLIADFGTSGSLSDLGLCADRLASISEQCITIGDKAQFTFDDCEPWRPPGWPPAVSPPQLAEVRSALAHLTAAEAPEEGFGQLSCLRERGANETPLARMARPRVTRFESWLRDVLDTHHVPTTASSEPVRGLIGLGPGLTPSGDDFLVGALALLDALAERKAHAAFARAIAVAPRGLTSPLSECLLRAAAAGHVGETLCRAASAVISGAAETAVATIRNVGHSSGWDMLAGIATALEVVVCVRRIGGRKALDPKRPIREAFASV